MYLPIIYIKVDSFYTAQIICMSPHLPYLSTVEHTAIRGNMEHHQIQRFN